MGDSSQDGSAEFFGDNAHLFLIISFGLALLGLLATQVLGNRGAPQRPAGGVPPTFARTSFRAQTHRRVREDMVTAQYREEGRAAPTPREIAQGVVEVGAGMMGNREFPARHVEADSFLRRATMFVLRAPTEQRLQALQALFDAFNPVGEAATVLRGVGGTITGAAYNPQRWYAALGPVQVRALRNGITNCLGNLYLGEGQGNLRAGTHTDITDDAVAIHGREHISRIINEAIALRRILGFHPRLTIIQGQPFLADDDATGEYRHLGYHPARPQDAPHNPIRMVNLRNAITLASNSGLDGNILLAAHYYPERTLMLILVLLALLWAVLL